MPLSKYDISYRWGVGIIIYKLALFCKPKKKKLYLFWDHIWVFVYFFLSYFNKTRNWFEPKPVPYTNKNASRGKKKQQRISKLKTNKVHTEQQYERSCNASFFRLCSVDILGQKPILNKPSFYICYMQI